MFKKQKGGGFIKYLPVKMVTTLALLFFIIVASIVFAESGRDNDNEKNTGKKNENAAEMISICHATGSQKNPYVFLEVDSNSVNGNGANNHSSHSDDIIPIMDLDGNGDIDVDDCNFAVAKQPIANDDAYSVDEDSILNISAPGLLENDEDVFASDITVAALKNPSHGILSARDDGSFTYAPEENYFGEDSFSYRVCANDLCDDGLVNITIDSVNDAPEINDDFATASKNTPVVINVLHDDTDAENNIDPSSVTVVSEPSHGTAAANSDGTITYTPNQDYVGSDTFTYSVCDLKNACSQAEATVTVETVEGEVVTNITVGQDFAETNEDTLITIAVLENDVDARGGILRIDSILVDALHGKANIVGDAIVYTPNPDYFGADSFVYLVCDNQSAPVCVESSPVSIEIISVNDAPVANGDIVSIGENDSVIIHASHDDYDVEENINPHSVTIITPPTNGSAVVNNGDTIIYTANSNFSGMDKITYQICDFDNACDTADIIITIIASDHPPVTENDTLSIFTNKNGIVNVLANDVSSAGELHIGSIVSLPDNGTAVINQDNTITYTPTADFNGEDIFTYSACDSKNNCSPGAAMITVSVENTAPTALDDFATTRKNTPVVINILHDDTDAENNIDPTSITIASAPSHGTAITNSDGTITYTPNQDYVGSDTFTYSVCDLKNACSQAEATVTVETVEGGGATRSVTSPTASTNGSGGVGGSPLTGPEQVSSGSSESLPQTDSGSSGGGGGGGGGSATYFALTATNDEISIHKNSTASINVLKNDSPENIAVSKIVSQPSHGTAEINGANITYIPQSEFVGEDVFTYLVCRTDNPQICSDAKVAAQVYETDTTPIAHNDMASTHENEPVVLYVLANDIDNEHNIDAESLTVTTFPVNGFITIDKAIGAITYYPDVGFVGTNSFTYSVCDSDSQCAESTAFIDVFNAEHGPQQEKPSDTAQTFVNTEKIIEIPFSESEFIKLHVSSHNGAVAVNGEKAFTYAPKKDYTGMDSFSYFVCGKTNETICNEQTINIVVLKNKEIASPGQCQPYLLEYIKFGSKNNNPVEVKKLQEFLKNKEGFADIDISGVYDGKTHNYVKQFQSDYMKDILIPWGVLSPTGYVYKTTKQKINELYCSCGKYLKEYIKFGAQNSSSEVEKLQHFLKDYEGHSNISITGIYDEKTYAAVKEFQVKYKSDILSPWSASSPTGYVYKTTKQKINELYCEYAKK